MPVLVACVAAGCARFPVKVEIDNTAGETDLSTYDWFGDAGSLPKDPRINAAEYDEMIRGAVTKSVIMVKSPGAWIFDPVVLA